MRFMMKREKEKHESRWAEERKSWNQEMIDWMDNLSEINASCSSEEHQYSWKIC